MRHLRTCLFVAATSFCSVSLHAQKPNILLVVADDLGYGDLGSYGQQKIRTPELDNMAQEGMRFTQHYAGAPVCGPSRASLYTGLDTGHSPIRGNPRWTLSGTPVDFSESDVLFSQLLQEAGYKTAVIGKWGMSENTQSLISMPNQQGFDYFFGYRQHKEAHHYYYHQLYRNNQPVILKGNDALTKQGRYTHDLFTEDALSYLEQAKTDQPWFLQVNYTIPHLEVTVPEDSKQAYLKLGWPKRKMNQNGHYRNDPEGNTAYAGMVSRMDRDVGRLLEKLKQTGMDKNTLVIFTSDNGHEFDRNGDKAFFDSNGPLRGKKRDLYEGGIRVPMIAWWPGRIAAGSESDHISAFWDYMATFCQLSGRICPQNNGISFLPTLMGQVDKQQKHPYLYWEFNEKKGPLQAVRQGPWKLVKRHGKALELYQLQDDIGESHNLAAKFPERVAALSQLLTTAREPHPEFPLTHRKPAPGK